MARKRSEIKVSASDALEFEPVKTVVQRPRRLGLRIAFGLIFLSAIGAVGWNVYGDRLITMIGYAERDAPLLRPEAGPVKVRPNNPGGLKVPYRDKLVYKRLSNGGSDAPVVERLLPPPESPISLPKQEPQLPQSKQPITAQVPSLKDVRNVTPPEPAPPSVAIQSPDHTVGPGKHSPISSDQSKNPSTMTRPLTPGLRVAQQLAQEKTIRAAKKTIPEVANAFVSNKKRASGSKSKAYQVQLAASRSSERARTEWKRLQRKNLDLLGDLELTVVRVDLGKEKGVFFRLRVGPLSNVSEARQLCSALKKRRIGCLVVRPGT